jgi:hypothetical protein
MVVPVDKPAIITIPEIAPEFTIPEVTVVVPIATVAVEVTVTIKVTVTIAVASVSVVLLSRGQRGATRHQCRSYQQHS